MSFDESLRSVTLNADATLALYTGVPGQPGSPSPHGGKIYRFVKVTGSVQVGIATAVADVIGVVQNKPQATGAAATVAISGISNVVVDTLPIAAGDNIAPTATGGAVKATAGSCGVALKSASTVGELIPVLLKV